MRLMHQWCNFFIISICHDLVLLINHHFPYALAKVLSLTTTPILLVLIWHSLLWMIQCSQCTWLLYSSTSQAIWSSTSSQSTIFTRFKISHHAHILPYPSLGISISSRSPFIELYPRSPNATAQYSSLGLVLARYLLSHPLHSPKNV